MCSPGNPSLAMGPLSPQAFQILLSLLDRDLHGYAIILDVEARTAGEISLTASTLYAAIQRMVAAGLIREVHLPREQEPDERRRRYYAITPLGREVAAAEARRLDRLTASARQKRLLPPLGPAPEPR
jgi:DNA-binding PadR family transcriptional regulator